jgi:L-asparaginase
VGGVGDDRTRARDMRGFGSEMSVVVDFDRIVYWRAPLPAASAHQDRQAALHRNRSHVRPSRRSPDKGRAGPRRQTPGDPGSGVGRCQQANVRAIKDAIVRDVPVVITSRVPNGRVLPNYGWEGGGKSLVDAGAVISDDLSARKARILLMLLL